MQTGKGIASECSRTRCAHADDGSRVHLVHARHHELGDYWLACQGAPELLFTENESNAGRLWGVPSRAPFVKDGIHEAVVNGVGGKVNPQCTGTKMSAHYRLVIAPGETATVLLRLSW